MENKVEKKYETVQVFSYFGMPHAFNGIENVFIIGDRRDGCHNDSYHRWYPAHILKKEIGEWERFKNEKEWEAARLLNEWLIEQGMVVDEKDEYFYVLIYVTW